MLLAALLTFRMGGTEVSVADNGASSISFRFAAGITGYSYIYILFILTVTGAGIGYLRGRLRPSRVRHELDFGWLVERRSAPRAVQATGRALRAQCNFWSGRVAAVATAAESLR